MSWDPIETCLPGVEVIFWWRPASDNPFVETCVIGSLPPPGHLKYGKCWRDPRTGIYQDVWHVTHWRPLPEMPADRAPLLEKALLDELKK